MELAVLLKGTLRGLDLEARCEVLATRILGAELNTYTGLRMLHAPTGWPEGEYVIELEHLKLRGTLRKGHWHIDETMTQVRHADKNSC